MSDLLRRVLTALVLAPLALGAVAAGGVWFAALLVVAVLLCQAELFELCEAEGLRPFRPAGFAAGVAVVLAPLWGPALAVASLALLGGLAAELGRRRERPLANAAALVLGAFYPAALAAWVGWLRVAPVPAVGEAGAAWLTVTALATVWGADTAAYFGGRALGRTPLFPRVSPKKTVEGLAAGVVAAVALALVLKAAALPFLGWSSAVVLGVLAGVVGPVGDLTASLFKRSVGAKDTGRLLPGHGGLLDRVDAVLFAVPLMALYLHHAARVF